MCALSPPVMFCFERFTALVTAAQQLDRHKFAPTGGAAVGNQPLLGGLLPGPVSSNAVGGSSAGNHLIMQMQASGSFGALAGVQSLAAAQTNGFGSSGNLMRFMPVGTPMMNAVVTPTMNPTWNQASFSGSMYPLPAWNNSLGSFSFGRADSLTGGVIQPFSAGSVSVQQAAQAGQQGQADKSPQLRGGGLGQDMNGRAQTQVQGGQQQVDGSRQQTLAPGGSAGFQAGSNLGLGQAHAGGASVSAPGGPAMVRAAPALLLIHSLPSPFRTAHSGTRAACTCLQRRPNLLFPGPTLI